MPRTAGVWIVLLLLGGPLPARGHDALSAAEIEAAVERVLQRRAIQQRNFELCDQLSERLVTESMDCLTGQMTTRCADGSVTNELVKVLDRPECSHYSKIHDRCWNQWLASADPFAAHVFVVCMNDPLGWIRAPQGQRGK